MGRSTAPWALAVASHWSLPSNYIFQWLRAGEGLLNRIFEGITGSELNVLELSRTEYAESRNFSPQEVWVDALRAVQAVGERRAVQAGCSLRDLGDVMHISWR